MASIMNPLIYSLLFMLRSWFCGRASLALEILALRHQLAVLERQKRRASLRATDRLLWVLLSRIWTRWRAALVIVQPQTVVAWHRKGFRLYWRWKSRAGKCGRPRVSHETRELIKQMSRANPLWGAPRIHGELLKLGIEISQATVAKYMVRRRKPPSQTWRTFLENHVQQLVAIDFLVVPTRLIPRTHCLTPRALSKLKLRSLKCCALVIATIVSSCLTHYLGRLKSPK